ncbi:MMPL family transporter, partial [candidate division KSB3 bacterium]|nr:MMPL family transporter [candidate division KSB3 bacterium]MBD3325022.1 MMPL family transporter [candidate division KSB3 bacterium]
MLISNVSITHKTTVLILIVIIVIIGVNAYITLPREAAPDITFPFIMVFSNYEGTSPSDMESLVTRPLERKLQTLSEVKEMTSTSMEGSSQIFLEFETDVDTDTALQQVRDKVDQAKPDLPSDMNDPIINEFSSSDWPIMFVVISGEVGLVQLKHIAEELEEEIEGVSGVLEAEIVGGLEREIRVEYNQDRLTAYGLVLSQVIQTVRNNNQNMPGGSLDIGEARYVLKAPAEISSPTEIDNLVIAVKDGKPIYISDVADIRDTYKDRDSYSRLNGVESVSIRVTKRAGEHLLRIAEEIKQIVNRREETLPEQVAITVTSDQSEEIYTMVADLENNIVTGLLLVLIVIFTSLGFRNAILVALAIPFSMLFSFFIIQSLGITLNFVVLFSLILALGMLVDNAIVIVENIYRHHTTERKPLIRAAMEGTSEVAWPVIASTATTVAAFIPLLFWPGIMGEFMGYLPKTVIIALLASLFVAMVITPTLSSIFIKASTRPPKKPKKGKSKQFGPIVRTYRRLLSFSLQYRLLFLFLFFSVLVLMIYAFTQSGLGVEMFPDTEPRRITVKLQAPEGTNIQQTNNFASKAETILKKYGNIRYVTTMVGNDGPNSAEIVVDMVDRELRKGPQEPGTDDGKIYFKNSNDTLEAVRQDLVASIVGAEVNVDKAEEGPPVGAPINVEIHGDEYEILAQIAEELKTNIQDLPGIVDLQDDYEAGLPEIQIDIDKERAALLDLDAATIGFLIKGAVNGIEIGKYHEGEDEYDIVARLPEEQRENIQNIMRIRIPDPTGDPIPLSSVATISTTSGLSAIKHIDQRRVVTVSSNVAKGFNAQRVLGEVRKIANSIQLPVGYVFQYTGENEEMQKSQAFMSKAFVIAVLLIAFVLVTQFDSILTPFIIMTSVILSFIGVFLGLIMTQKP